MQAHDLTIDLPHIRLAARAWGNASLPPLLALHGWLDNAATHDRLAPLLCEHFHFVALDLPGHGHSQHRPNGAGYHFTDYLPDVLGAADTLGWTSFHLLGHSLGAGIASVLAAACPQRVQSLILIELLGPMSKPADKTLDLLRRSLIAYRETGTKPLRIFATVEEAMAAREKANNLSPKAAAILVERGLNEVPDGFSWSSDPRLTLPSPQRFSEAQLLDLMHGIRAPTLLILAEPDTWPSLNETLDARIAQVADIEVVRLPGNHHLHLENPLPVATTILAFTQRLRERSAPATRVQAQD